MKALARFFAVVLPYAIQITLIAVSFAVVGYNDGAGRLVTL